MTCTGGNLAGERVASGAQEVRDASDSGVAVAGLGDLAHQPSADDHALRLLPDPARLPGRRDPEADGDRDGGFASGGRDQLAELGWQLGALARHPYGRNEIDEALGALADPPSAFGRRGRRDQGNQREITLPERLGDRSALFEREVRDYHARGAGQGGLLG